MKIQLALLLVSAFVAVQGTIHPFSQAFKFYKVYRPHTRIFKGKPAIPGNIPWQVAVHMTNSQGQGYFCGGSLISNRHVLTAAHCVKGYVQWKLRFGATRTDINEQQAQVQTTNQAVYHSQYDDQTLRNDIGVIFPPNLVQLDQYAAIIPLPRRSESSNTLTGYSILVSGWGKTNDQSPVSNQLNYVYENVISNDDCRKIYGNIIYDTTICIKGPNMESTCGGDSGGPLIYANSQGVNTLGGAVSFGTQSCTQGTPTGFTRVVKYLDWINAQTGIPIQN